MFGAGNIGRSFIAQLFSRAGYETVFIDIREPIIEALNRFGKYRIEIRDRYPETIWITNVRGISARDVSGAAQEVADADIIATAVGPDNLQAICPAIAQGILIRQKQNPDTFLDIIICENLRNASYIFKQGLLSCLPPGFNPEELPGLVETSIGKMVPIITDAEASQDPLAVYAEAYNTLILDARAFKGDIPQVPGLDPKQQMKAYVDRKLFIHNLGHSLTAYLGFLVNKKYKYIWEAISDSEIQDTVRCAMSQSGDALIAEYPDEFTLDNQKEHIEDLLRRFSNKALGDTIYRVGRDLQRKLSPDERLIGGLRLQLKHDVPYNSILLGIGAALLFRATDENGKQYERDKKFIENLHSGNFLSVLQEISGFDPERENKLLANIQKYYNCMVSLSSLPSFSLQKFYRCIEN